MSSVLVRNQKKIYGPKRYKGGVITAEVRFDDECKNGHNTFSITAAYYEPRRVPGESKITFEDGSYWLSSCGQLREKIAAAFPELNEYLKWHLCSTDGPLYYIANTVYHAECGKLEWARNSAVWPEATLEQLQDKELLAARLPKLLKRFREDVEELGFVW